MLGDISRCGGALHSQQQYWGVPVETGIAGGRASDRVTPALGAGGSRTNDSADAARATKSDNMNGAERPSFTLSLPRTQTYAATEKRVTRLVGQSATGQTAQINVWNQLVSSEESDRSSIQLRAQHEATCLRAATMFRQWRQRCKECVGETTNSRKQCLIAMRKLAIEILEDLHAYNRVGRVVCAEPNTEMEYLGSITLNRRAL